MFKKKPVNEYVSLEIIEARERRAGKIALAKYICVNAILPVTAVVFATKMTIDKLNNESDDTTTPEDI